MLRVMIFIDGTWLYSNTPRLSDVYGQQDFRVDFGKLPNVLAEEVAKQMNGATVDLVRTYLFGSYAANYDPRDEESVQRRRDFFDMLREEYHYEVETYPINFLGRRLRRADRDPLDTFEPKEKCVDISLATAMLYYAAVPQVYDIAIAVVGDQDFKPVLQHVRKLGKRVAIASIKGSCAPDYSDTRDEARVRDFDTIWLDELLHRLELKYERHLLACESPNHKGKREVWTTFHPRKGQKFFCDACRREFTAQREAAREPLVTQPANQPANGPVADSIGGPGPEPASKQPTETSDDVATPSASAAAPTSTFAIPLSDASACEIDQAADQTSDGPVVAEPTDGYEGDPTAVTLAVPAAFLVSGTAGLTFTGYVKRRVAERGFGFIEAADGRDYFFHLTDLRPGFYFDDVIEGMQVDFEVKKEPIEGRAGAAQGVRRHAASASAVSTGAASTGAASTGN